MSTLALDGVSPRSRRTDPTTSVDAGRAADLSRSQREVLNLFKREARPLADHVLVEVAFNRSLLGMFTPQRIRSARSELAAAGLLVLVEGVTQKTRRGRNARVWALAEGKN